MCASGFPESVCVVVSLHRVCVTVCVCVQMFVCIVCVYLFERERDQENTHERVYGWLLGFTSLELVHYSLTVLPSEIPGSGCVSHTCAHTHTKNTYTHKQKNAHIHSSSIPDHCSTFLFRTKWRLQKVDCSAQEGETDERERLTIVTFYKARQLYLTL